jgi:hypothetical protein
MRSRYALHAANKAGRSAAETETRQAKTIQKFLSGREWLDKIIKILYQNIPEPVLSG